MKQSPSKVAFISSVRTKILSLLAIAIAITGLIMIFIYSPNVKKNLLHFHKIIYTIWHYPMVWY